MLTRQVGKVSNAYRPQKPAWGRAGHAPGVPELEQAR
jgi:hypothetical protein